jgi:hypothetical protein
MSVWGFLIISAWSVLVFLGLNCVDRLGDRYLDALGSLATQSHSVLARQDLIGGDYELIDRDTWSPNPDYWLAYLWPRLMSPYALAVIVSVDSDAHEDPPSATHGDDTFLRAYAQCGLYPNDVRVTCIDNSHVPQSCYKRVAEGTDLTGGALMFSNGL